jgi:hypothetical protein
MGLVAIAQTELLAKTLREHFATVGAFSRDSTTKTHLPVTKGEPS